MLREALQHVRRATIVIDTTLRSGSYAIPGVFGTPTRLRVPESATATIRCEVERRGEHLQIVEARLRITPMIRILNPRRSLHAPNGFLRDLIDRIKDALADLRTSGAQFDPITGELTIEGIVDVLRVFEQPVPDEINPRINLDLKQLLLPAPDSPPPITDVPETEPLPSTFGRALLLELETLVTPGKFRVQVDADAPDLAQLVPGAVLPSPGALSVVSEGTFQFRDAALLITCTPAVVCETPLGSIRFGGSATASFDPTGQPVIDGAFSLDVESALQRITITKPVAAQFVVTSWKLPIEAAVHVHGSTWEASVEAKPTLGISGDEITVKVNRTPLRAIGLAFECAGAVRAGASRAGVRVAIPQATCRAQLAKADFDVLGETSSLEVGFSADVTIRDATYTVASRELGGHVIVNYKCQPRGLLAEIVPQLANIGREIALELHPRGRGRLDGAFGFLEEVLSPVLAFVGPHAEPTPAPAQPAAGVDAASLGLRISELTKARVLEGNSINLLADSAAAQRMRIELIADAKHTISLQRGVLHDDATELADALVAAAKRGVRTRVLVDGIASLERVGDMTTEKPIYKRLRTAGVELHVFNDPRVSGLAQLLADVSVLPELEGDSFQDLAQLRDPVQAAMVFLRLIAFVDAAEPASERRKLVSEGLAQLLLQNRVLYKRPTADDAQIPRGPLHKVLYAALHVAALSYRIGEQLLVVDGSLAVVGGLDSGAELSISGPAAADLADAFTTTWNATVSTPQLPHVSWAGAMPADTTVQVVAHRPRTDGSQPIARAMIEAVRATPCGTRIRIASRTFLPTGNLAQLRTVLCEAARRGVDVRVLVTADPHTITAAVFSWREMLEAGCRIFTAPRTGAAFATFGATALIGATTWDDRAATLTSQLVTVVYDEQLAAALERIFDEAAGKAEELTANAIATQPLGVELKSAMIASIAKLL